MPIPKIALVTGHSLSDVEAVPDHHDLGGKMQLAEQAIAKLAAFQEAKKQGDAAETWERENDLRTDSAN